MVVAIDAVVSRHLAKLIILNRNNIINVIRDRNEALSYRLYWVLMIALSIFLVILRLKENYIAGVFSCLVTIFVLKCFTELGHKNFLAMHILTSFFLVILKLVLSGPCFFLQRSCFFELGLTTLNVWYGTVKTSLKTISLMFHM